MIALFDIGASNIRIAISSDGKSLSSVVFNENPKKMDDTLELIKASVEKLSDGEKINKVSGGLKGVIKNNTAVKIPLLDGWDGKNLKDEFNKIFPESVVNIVNDADLAGLGEAHFGAGKGFDIVAYITISTGIGGGRIVGGNIDEYKYGFELGKQITNSLSDKNFEDTFSGGAIFNNTGKKVMELPKNELKEVCKGLGTGIYNTILHWSPDVIVLGGAVPIDVPEVVGLIEDEVKSVMKIFPEIPVFKRTELENEAALWGALKL